MMRETSAVCIACPARSAITWPEQRLTDQRQIPDQIEHFMAAAFVRESQAARDS